MPEMLHLGCNVVSGIFTSKKSRRIAESLGLKTLCEANYIEWANKNKVSLQENESNKKLTACVMARRIEKM